MKVRVTGAAGFIRGYLVEELLAASHGSVTDGRSEALGH